MKIYELMPTNGRKSFYGKAMVAVNEDGSEVLYSYCKPIVSKDANGKMKRLYFDIPSLTTSTHIKAFCGLNRRQFLALS